jgi:hypothetical protein
MDDLDNIEFRTFTQVSLLGISSNERGITASMMPRTGKRSRFTLKFKRDLLD